MSFIKKNKILILSILTLALPAIIEMALNTLVGLVDTIMVSRIIGLEGLAAAGFANQLIFTIIFIFSSFNAGATAMIARSYGEKNMPKLNQVLGQNLVINMIIGLIITFFAIRFAPNLLSIFDVSPEVFASSVGFFKIIAFGIFFMFISFAAKASLRGASDTKTPMIVTAVVNLLNIVGNYVLMTGFWIFPNLGLNGAAVATTFVRFLDALIFLFLFFKGKGEIKLIFANLKINREILKPLWRLSSSAAVEQTLMQISFLLSGIIISQLDTLAEGSFRILLNIESISFMPAVGFSIAASALVGKSLGERDEGNALRTGYLATAMGAVWGVLVGSIFALAPMFFLRFFSQDPAILTVSKTPMYALGLNQLPLAFWIIMSGALRGAGDTKGVMIIASMRVWLVFIPLCYLYIITLGLGVIGFWWAELSSLVIFDFIIYHRFKKMKWAKISI